MTAKKSTTPPAEKPVDPDDFSAALEDETPAPAGETPASDPPPEEAPPASAPASDPPPPASAGSDDTPDPAGDDDATDESTEGEEPAEPDEDRRIPWNTSTMGPPPPNHEATYRVLEPPPLVPTVFTPSGEPTDPEPLVQF